MLQQWQKPWLWLRVLAGGIVVCGILYLAFLVPRSLSPSGSAYPALMLVNFIFPPFVSALAVMILLWELNIPRDISIYSMMGYFILGGALSISLTQLLDIAGMPTGDAPLAPLTEEPGKLLAVMIFLALAARSGKNIYGLTGLLIGAGVGAGFTAFESVQYAFYGAASVEEALRITFRRSFPKLGGHILYCAPYAAGLALARCVHKDWKKALISTDFLLPFAGSCFGHFLWNYNASYLGSAVLQWIIAAGMWYELLWITRKCLAQIVGGPAAGLDAGRGEASAVLRITCVSGPLQGQSWRLQDGGVILGRDLECGIRPPAMTPGVSRRHCCIRQTANGWTVTDLNSSNGTYLTSGRLPPGAERPLRSGEIIYLGSAQNAFRIWTGTES